MPIQISQFETKPAVAINEVHLVELRVNLTEENDSKASVRIVTKLFGRDENGIKHFEPAQRVTVLEDAYAAALADAMQGDMTLAQALGAIEAAVAVLLQRNAPDLGTVAVV